MDWKDLTVSLSDLKFEAEGLEPWSYGAYSFLQNIGVVPWSVKTMKAEKVRFGFDRNAVPAGYLASAAYEWDTWGPSEPSDFIEAIEDELNPRRREFISMLLTSLGRTVQE